MNIPRRHFLKTAAAFSLGFSGLQHLLNPDYTPRAHAGSDSPPGYGPLQPDPDGILDLPPGFSYRIFSRVGEEMDDGFLVPHLHDGMAAFAGPEGTTILVRNHEMSTGPAGQGPFGPENQLLSRLEPARIYDRGEETPCLGGTTTLVYDTASGQLKTHFLSLAGTVRNCAGGPTPWNTWISCEESTSRAGEGLRKDHGFNFEVPASAQVGATRPIPLKAMGRLVHEAVAVDPHSGIVYQTEDRGDGLIYRFIPDEPGKLAEGGRLQCLRAKERHSLDTRNWEHSAVERGQIMPVEWIDVQNVESPQDDLRLQGFSRGAARFARGEGMWYSDRTIYFVCTNGGSTQKGQVWRYRPSPHEGRPEEQRHAGTLELFIQPDDPGLVENADNVTATPWGDLILCEDGPDAQYLVGVTPQGQLYKLGHNALSTSEFAGATFSPDGTTLFVNIQGAGMSLAIQGPWKTAPGTSSG